jgi:hypothetical protein
MSIVLHNSVHKPRAPGIVISPCVYILISISVITLTKHMEECLTDDQIIKGTRM